MESDLRTYMDTRFTKIDDEFAHIDARIKNLKPIDIWQMLFLILAVFGVIFAFISYGGSSFSQGLSATAIVQKQTGNEIELIKIRNLVTKNSESIATLIAINLGATDSSLEDTLFNKDPDIKRAMDMEVDNSSPVNPNLWSTEE